MRWGRSQVEAEEEPGLTHWTWVASFSEARSEHLLGNGYQVLELDLNARTYNSVDALWL